MATMKNNSKYYYLSNENMSEYVFIHIESRRVLINTP